MDKSMQLKTENNVYFFISARLKLTVPCDAS